MSEPFKDAAMVDAPMWKRIFGLGEKFNAVVELNNTLAKSSDIMSLPLSTLNAINTKYGCAVQKKFAAEVRKLYENYVTYCFRDGALSEDEAVRLEHLQRVLGITDHEVTVLNEQAARSIYRKKLATVLSDGVLTDNERAYLENLSSDLDISEKVRREIYTQESQKKFQSMLDHFTSDGMLSPDEEAKLESFRKSISAALQFDFSTADALRKYKLMWQIRKGELPIVDPGITLQREEVCHYVTDCEWHEMRKNRVGTAYAGPTMRVKIAKGVYYRMGALAHAPVTVDAIVKIDAGRVFVTNKRLVFMGANKNVSLKLDKILDIEPFSDAVKIEKDTGRSPYLFTDEPVFLAAFIARLIGS